MQSNMLTNSRDQAQEQAGRLRLHEGEQLIAAYPSMQRWQALLWLLLILSSGGSGLGLAIVIAWLAPGGEGLGLYDRVLRLILNVNGAIFGRHIAHLTSQRLIIEAHGQPLKSYALGDFAGMETRTFHLGGNLCVHLRGAVKRRLDLWVVRCGEVAEQLRAVCQGRYRR